MRGDVFMDWLGDCSDLSCPLVTITSLSVCKWSNENVLWWLLVLEQERVVGHDVQFLLQDRLVLVLVYFVICVAHHSNEHVEDDKVDEECRADEVDPGESGVWAAFLRVVVSREVAKREEILMQKSINEAKFCDLGIIELSISNDDTVLVYQIHHTGEHEDDD